MNIKESEHSNETLETHFGSCHCGKVKFSVKAPRKLIVYSCKLIDFELRIVFINLKLV